MFFWDPTMILLLPAIAFALWAQFKVKSSFKKYSKIYASSNFTGAQVARKILDSYGLQEVRVEATPGELTDHYDPRDKTLRLSEPVYGSPSLAAIGVAAHEAGHAVQHAKNYSPLALRSAIVPVAQIGNYASWPLLIIGLMLGNNAMGQLFVELGVLIFSGVVVFQLVTLPVEFNASSRALAVLTQGGYLEGDELTGAKRVLSAAAMTYVAAALMGILQLLRLLIMSGLLGRRDD